VALQKAGVAARLLSALFYKAMINMGKGGGAQNWDDKVHQGHA
jgi:hypothetical protein